jgi:hypothetical protein
MRIQSEKKKLYDAKYSKEHRKIKSERTVTRQREKKAALVEYKGGKCCVCGYAECHRALDFHHTGKKNFEISSRRDISLKKLKKEADNTILVCRNCHSEIHAGMHEKYAN